MHDIGSAPLSLMVNSNYPSGLPYTGPNTDGGSFVGQAVGYPWFNQDDDAFGGACSIEAIIWQQADIALQQIFFIMRTGASATFLDVSATRKLSGHGITATLADAANLAHQVWVHVVFTITAGGAGLLYKNALQIGTGAVGVPPAGNYRYAIGGNVGSSSNPWQGGISEVAVYPTVLSPTRINAHFLQIPTLVGRPVFRGGGIYPNSTGGTTLDSESIASILAAVRKFY